MEMNEEFLHFIWAQELFNKELIADTGEKVEVISTGTLNKDAGPDFLNARIKIDNTIWAGNVEIHTDSANWEKHKHNIDKGYDSVILHVVYSNNQPTVNSNGRKISTVVLDFDSELYEKYQKIVAGKMPVPCHRDLKKVDDFIINMWFNSLIAERLEEKTDYLKLILELTKGNWEETFYIALARTFGFKTNALPFEMLAKSIPLKLLSKYKSDLKPLEALLFGQAGFFESQAEDKYTLLLQKEYEYIRTAHRLKPLENHLWKFLRLRPANFPTIRIAQFASLVHQSQHLFSKTIEANSFDELFKLYNCSVSEYWENHYSFGKLSKPEKKSIGKSSVFGIFINTVIPFIFLYGKQHGNNVMTEKAIGLLEQLPAEKNHIVESWIAEGIKVNNSLQSQALLQLTSNYCISKNCLYCQIGNTIIRNRE
jgi:hypothetical protein